MKLFRELLFTLDHGHLRRSDSGETKPVAHPGLFRRVQDDVTDSDVEMKFDESSSTQDCFDRIPGSTIRSTVEVHHRLSDPVAEEVAGIYGAGILKLFE